MRVSRGSFLKICGAAALAPSLPADSWLAPATGVPAATPTVRVQAGGFRLRDASAAQFRPLLNTSFTVRPGGKGDLRFVLARVTEWPIAQHVEQFSLIFHAPAGTPVPQGTHAFHHPALGAFDLFIVPVGSPHRRYTAYEACFSRHVGPAGSDAWQLIS